MQIKERGYETIGSGSDDVYNDVMYVIHGMGNILKAFGRY
jgi:hypothetical protein